MCPNGKAPGSRSPTGAQPRSLVIFGLVEVSCPPRFQLKARCSNSNDVLRLQPEGMGNRPKSWLVEVVGEPRVVPLFFRQLVDATFKKRLLTGRLQQQSSEHS